MINLDVFLVGLLVVSTLTSLVTEAVKKILTEFNVNYFANTLAGIVSAVLSIGVGVGYIAFMGIGFTAQSIVCIIALMFMSWLASMVGYDKVVQIIKQFKTK
jgi:hypothetical protein